MTGVHGTPAERFWRKVQQTDSCWLWTGAQTSKGYGSFYLGPGHRPGIKSAHRWAYEELVGPIPEGLVLDHLCRVPLCVRPSHLEATTNLINLQRGINLNIRARLNGTCRRGHERNAQNARSKSDGAFDCIACRRIRNAAMWRPRRVELGQPGWNAHLTASAVIDIRRLFALGVSQRTLAQRYKISERSMYDVVAMRTWKRIDALAAPWPS